MITVLACQCDSVVIRAFEKIFPVVQGTQEECANCADVLITKTICCSAVWIVFICVLGFLAWKQIDHHAKKNVDERKRKWDVEDKNRKQKADLLDKKLQILCETCYDLSKDEPKKVVKKYDDGAVKNYITALDEALGITPKPQGTQTQATPQSDKPEG